ncbi:hypothetical protein CHELA41_24256 [Hyphomicrobiales bacterium]|nr:hypothetical protein CHELA41_24256 [Hyphomicrobiales bacterium]
MPPVFLSSCFVCNSPNGSVAALTSKLCGADVCPSFAGRNSSSRGRQFPVEVHYHYIDCNELLTHNDVVGIAVAGGGNFPLSLNGSSGGRCLSQL